jgi:hypothetical protein
MEVNGDTGKMKLRTFEGVLILTLLMAASLPAATTFDLPNNGVISGTPGQLIGWDFTITNDIGYLVVSQAVFCEGAFSSSGCVNTLGVFTDFIAGMHPSDPPVFAPGIPQSETFALANFQGVGSFAIDNNAAPGASDIGTLFLVYDRFTCDIVNDSLCEPTQTDFSQIMSASARVDVIAPLGVPEPAAAALLAAGLAVIGWRTRRKR